MVSVTASALGCQGCKSLAKLSHVGPTQQSCPLPPLPQMLLTLPLPPKRNTVHIVEPASGTTSTTYNDHFPTPIFRCDGFDEPPSLSIPSSPLTCSHSQLTQTSKIQLPKSCFLSCSTPSPVSTLPPPVHDVENQAMNVHPIKTLMRKYCFSP